MTVLPYEEALAAYDPVLGLRYTSNSIQPRSCSAAVRRRSALSRTLRSASLLGSAGSLPVVNANAVESAIRIGLR